MNATWNHGGLLGGKPVLVGLTAVLAAASPALGDRLGDFEIQILQPGNDGAGSRASSVAVGDINGDGIPDIVIGGEFHDPDSEHTVPLVATALCTNEVLRSAKFEFIKLPHLGYGGTVNGVTVPAGDGNDAVVLCAAGSVNAASGQPLPAAFLKSDGTDPALIPLPTLGGMNGEATGIHSNWKEDGVVLLISGNIFNSDGTRQACAWECTFIGGDFDRPIVVGMLLDGLGGDSGASGLCQNDPVALGFSDDDSGRPQAGYWARVNPADERASEFMRLPNLPGGRRSQARGASKEMIEIMSVCGAAQNSAMQMIPTLWTVQDDGSASVKPLRLLPAFNQGRANGIIAILIGLLVPGEMSNGNGSVAALWRVNQRGHSFPVNLNALARGKPRGMTLQSAVAVQRYAEYEEIAVIAGQATDANGNTHGFVGIWREHSMPEGVEK